MKKIILGLLLLLGIGTAVLYYALYTSAGARIVIKFLQKVHPVFLQAQYDRVEGNLKQGLILRGVKIRHLPNFPVATSIEAQRVNVHIDILARQNWDVQIEQGRVVLEDGLVILIEGNWSTAGLAFNVFSPHLDIENLLHLFPDLNHYKITGAIDHAECGLTGQVFRLSVTGKCLISRLQYQRFFAQELPAQISLEITAPAGRLNLYGQVKLASGMVSGSSMATITLAPSQFDFRGDPRRVLYQVKGESQVDQTIIHLVLRGNGLKPDLQLTSDPMMPQEALLVMLATNKSWSNITGALSNGKISPDIAKDFIDYFVLNGQGKVLGEKFGIRNFTIHYDNQGTGLGITKEISKQLDAIYDIRTKTLPAGSKETKHIFGGELHVTDQISVNALRQYQFQEDPSGRPLPEQTRADGELLLKFKTKF
ncbi:MAG: translocation/assembly module TamB domain-containing protein [Candidatus Omnitrophica bacterium]|nr:translocation/assembly module TamB domain-containing protein [Candidatus Omnitrophota bacterium]